MPLYLMRHPAALFADRSPEHRDIFHCDLRRIVRLLSGYRPEYQDEFHLYTSVDELPTTGRIALDLETLPDGSFDMVGLAWSATKAALLPLPDPERLGTLLDVLRGRELIVHYGEGLEIEWLHNTYRCGPTDDLPLTVHDLHKLFHAWDPEYAAAGSEDGRHGGSGALAFIQSLYSWRPYHKHLLAQCYDRGRLSNPTLKARYCMLDAVVTWECFHRLEEVCHAEAPHAWEAYCRDAMPLLPIMVRSKRQGWLCDVAGFKLRANALRIQSVAAAEAVKVHYGNRILPKSKQAKTAVSLHALKQVLQEAGIKLPHTEKGNPQLDKKARRRLFIKHREFADLDRYLQLQDTLSDCYDPKIISADGRVHAHWSGYEVSWRWRPSQPNLTQRPPRERYVLIADPGHRLAHFDLDMGEYRWFAGECADPDLLQTIAEYDAGRAPKPHVLNASLLFGADLTEAQTWKDEQHPQHSRYVFAKNFIYGGALYTWKGGVVQLEDAAAKAGLTMTRPKLQALRDRWWAQWKVAPRWREQHVAEALRTRYVLCREWGYGRRLHGINFENEALNYPMQAGIAGLVNRTVCEVWEDLRVAPLANMHDGLDYQFRDDARFDLNVAAVRTALQRFLRTLGGIRIPAEVGVGNRWGQMQRWRP